MAGKSSPSLLTPLQMLRPVEDDEPLALYRKRMAILTHTPTISPFNLPDDWIVEERPRTSGFSPGVINRYYYEPGTGRQFRTLRSVEKYLTEAKESTSTAKPSKRGNCIKMLRWDEKEELHHKREMAIVALAPRSTPTTTSGFKLPDDWIVKEKTRTHGYSVGRIDKYYYEPGTGRQFRSLIAVERYLTGAEANTPTPKTLTWDSKEELHYKSEMAIVDPTNTRTSTFKLPVGWVIKKKLRRSGLTDKYYYEPGTGRQFRSLVSIERYLAEAGENTQTPKALKPDNCTMPAQDSGSWKENISSYKVKNSSFNFANPPVKIKWVLTGPGGDAWSPFMDDSMVPDSVKQQWAKTFVLSVNFGNFSAQSSEVND